MFTSHPPFHTLYQIARYLKPSCCISSPLYIFRLHLVNTISFLLLPFALFVPLVIYCLPSKRLVERDPAIFYHHPSFHRRPHVLSFSYLTSTVFYFRSPPLNATLRLMQMLTVPCSSIHPFGLYFYISKLARPNINEVEGGLYWHAWYRPSQCIRYMRISLAAWIIYDSVHPCLIYSYDNYCVNSTIEPLAMIYLVRCMYICARGTCN